MDWVNYVCKINIGHWNLGRIGTEKKEYVIEGLSLEKFLKMEKDIHIDDCPNKKIYALRVDGFYHPALFPSLSKAKKFLKEKHDIKGDEIIIIT